MLFFQSLKKMKNAIRLPRQKSRELARPQSGFFFKKKHASGGFPGRLPERNTG